ncbi:MAG: 50S ribosomal protein L15 [candidate division WOR-3 bacterium]|nr:50S ribosomal protein L15 [candidate division WOR-3 bacterium]
MKLSELIPKKGSTHRRKRRGCGPGSGHGKTSCRGHKGHKQRSGYRVKMGFEGGQMPLTRRLPKRGFRNFTKEEFEIVNLFQLAKFAPNTVVTPEFLKDNGLIKGDYKLKILSHGNIDRPLIVKTHAISKKAEEKIISAGGKVELIV